MKQLILLSALCVLCTFSASAEDFKGYPCTVDCSGHEAGYDWAEDKGIDDPGDCGGNSNSFIEGCQAYAEEQQGISDNDYGEQSPDNADDITSDYDFKPD